jgi:hypothetical protein
VDKAPHSTSSTARAPTKLTAATHGAAVTTRPAVAPPSEASSAATSRRLSSRIDSLPPPPVMRTPSLISGSSVSTFDSPRSHGLRRKASSIDKYTAQKRSQAAAIEADRVTMHSRNDRYNEMLDDSSILGISLPPTGKNVHEDAYLRTHTPASVPRDPYFMDSYPARDVTPSLPGLSHSTTPSTRYADSPYSRIHTPSSASSYSPGTFATTSNAPQPRPASPTRSRPPISGKVVSAEDTSRLGLPPVRESSTSSSNSTIKAGQGKVAPAKKELPRQISTAGRVSASQSTAKSLPTRQSSVQRKPIVSSRSSTQVVGIPPELAHLNVEPPNKAALQKPLPPLRPSRDGTPSLSDLQRPSPVVQSDLSKVYTTYHKRTPSQETPISASSPSFRSRFGLSPRSSSRQESPRVDSAISSPPPKRSFIRGATPDSSAPERPKLLRKDSPALASTAGPSPSKSPRFAFLTRKMKSDVSKVAEKPKREQRKGPSAGTGHEGYGRFGFRGRSGSTTSSDIGRSPSTDSSASNAQKPVTKRKSSLASKDGSDLDDFLRERLNPVVLRGSGSTYSNQASFSAVSIPESSSSPSLDSLVHPHPRLLPSAMDSDRGMSPAKRLPRNRQPPSESSEDDVSTIYPTLAARRSSNRLQTDRKESLRMPPPINTSLPAHTPSIDSYDPDTSAWPQTDSSLPPEESFEGKEGLWLRPQKASPAPKQSRKWNFFQRTHNSPGKGKGRVTDVDLGTSTHVSDAISQSIAHYAMLDPVEPVGLDEVERIIQDHETSAEESTTGMRKVPELIPYQRRHSGLLPSPPKAEFGRDSDFVAKPTPPRIMVRQDSSESPELLRAQTAVPTQMAQVVDIPPSPLLAQSADAEETIMEAPQLTSTPDLGRVSIGTPDLTDSPRQPRLSPIGRIPRVVSKRDRDRRMPDTSFSRPFANTQPKPSVRPPGSLYNQIRDLASPVDTNSQPVSSTSGRSDSISAGHKSSVGTDNPSDATNRTSADYYAGNEFMAFAPRKNSELSYSSSSGYGSWVAPFPIQAFHEDDVWNEYNDLLDEVLPPLKTPISGGSSLGAPFQYSDMLFDSNSPAMPAPLNFPLPPSQQPTSALPMPPRPQFETTVLSVPQQVSRLMQPSLSPLTPDTLAHFVGTYGDRNSSSMVSQNRSSFQPLNRSSIPVARESMASSRYSRSSRHSRSASLPEANVRNSQISLSQSGFNRDTQLLDIAEHDTDDNGSTNNLRLGALMTSKWLSFGRVLFSPAHNEMRLSDGPRVLVIDGLGSDWSHYVALSYPDAKVYDLSSPVQDDALPSASWQDLPNYQHINHASLSAPFPFPKGFFTAVVFRFPASTTDQAYQACIFECKRVLRPGGYLEVAVLDLDLMNMGSRGRKAVRGLKTRMQACDQSVSLRNMSDVLVRMIGRRGFEEIQRCIVGVPAAGRIPRSRDLSIRSSDSSGRPTWERETDTAEKELSFADLLQDARSSRIDPDGANDEGITKMVAKVGRWWYSACYEKPLLQNDKSIWNEPGLLRECEKQGTSFKLLICYAQKPTQTRRRTVSV